MIIKSALSEISVYWTCNRIYELDIYAHIDHGWTGIQNRSSLLSRGIRWELANQVATKNKKYIDRQSNFVTTKKITDEL